MSGSQTITTATSVRENLPAPRDLNQSFQRPATQQTSFSEINDVRHRITQLEREVHSLINEQTAKDNNIQALQTTVERLQSDMFDDIDGAGMQANPDDHLHSN
jgi:predicted  nucleic acid-binding Zn-ribbon protein